MPFFTVYCENNAKLIDKTVIITGCSSGIGREIVMDFYTRGARIIMINRNINKTLDTINEIKQKYIQLQDLGQLVFVQCNFTSLSSVKECAQNILQNEPHITILINNPGIMCTKIGFENHFEIYLGHFYLTMLLMPRIRRSVPARIVTISSDVLSEGDINFEEINSEKQLYNPLKSYSQFNLANILFTRQMAKKLKEHEIDGINTYCANPGFTNADVLCYLSDTLIWGALSILRILGPLMKTPVQCAQTAIYCAVDENCAEETGCYYRDCQISNLPSLDQDGEISKTLWDLSVERVNLKNYNPFTEPDRGYRTFENIFSL